MAAGLTDRLGSKERIWEQSQGFAGIRLRTVIPCPTLSSVTDDIFWRDGCTMSDVAGCFFDAPFFDSMPTKQLPQARERSFPGEGMLSDHKEGLWGETMPAISDLCPCMVHYQLIHSLLVSAWDICILVSSTL